MNETITAILHADGIACPDSRPDAGPSLLVRVDGRECTILAIGTDAEMAAHPRAQDAEVLDFSGHILMPALVNAHTHLDLTALGPQLRHPGTGFADWLNGVRIARNDDGASIAAAVDLGIRASLAGGVVAVGDISGRCRLEPWESIASSPLEGVSYLELFGLGDRQHAALAQIDAARSAIARAAHHPVRIGLSPHAPYSAGPEVFHRAAAQTGVPLSTHLAESEDERRVVCAGSGPMRDFFQSLGAWDDRADAHFSGHASPVQMAMPWLARAPWTLAHVNDCSDDDLAALATTRCSVVYCPRSSDYFDHHAAFGPHRYRDMLAAGINVALGTDSVLNLPHGPASERLSTLDEIRFLFRRDGTDPALLVRMATTHGARALGLDPSRFSAIPGPVAGLMAIPVDPASRGADPAERIARSDDGPILLWPAGPGLGVAHPHAGALTR